MANMAVVWERVGRQPRQEDFSPPISRFGPTPYVRHYGSWRKALEAFVAAATSGDAVALQPEALEQPESPASPQPQRHRTPRNAGWRLRHKVMVRDDFRCRMCGTSPAMRHGVILVLDHIKPWSAGGETTFDNLQTLCEQCNGGKSNLPMNENARGGRGDGPAAQAGPTE